MGRLDRGLLSGDRGGKDGRSGREDKGGTEHCDGEGGGRRSGGVKRKEERASLRPLKAIADPL